MMLVSTSLLVKASVRKHREGGIHRTEKITTISTSKALIHSSGFHPYDLNILIPHHSPSQQHFTEEPIAHRHECDPSSESPDLSLVCSWEVRSLQQSVPGEEALPVSNFQWLITALFPLQNDLWRILTMKSLNPELGRYSQLDLTSAPYHEIRAGFSAFQCSQPTPATPPDSMYLV